MRDRVLRVRIHGQEGHGATTAARLLAAAAHRDGLEASVPQSSCRERSGAPVEAYCRIGGDRLAPSRPDAETDALLIQDPRLMRQPDVLSRLTPHAYVLINAPYLQHLGLGELIRQLPEGHVLAVAAPDRHFPNVALLGALAGATGAVSLDALTAAIREHFQGDMAERAVCDATDAHARASRSRPRSVA
jgi:pyruvate ferredoxin oxidoreductase gamma subunit